MRKVKWKEGPRGRPWRPGGEVGSFLWDHQNTLHVPQGSVIIWAPVVPGVPALGTYLQEFPSFHGQWKLWNLFFQAALAFSTHNNLNPHVCLYNSHAVMSDSLRPMNCSLLDSSVHEIHQARILEWVAMPSSRGSSWSRDQTWVSCIAVKFFTNWATSKAPIHLSDPQWWGHWARGPAGVPAAPKPLPVVLHQAKFSEASPPLDNSWRAVPYLSPRRQPGQGHPSSVTREETERPQEWRLRPESQRTRGQHQEGNLRLGATNPVFSDLFLSSHRRDHPRGAYPTLGTVLRALYILT